MASTAQNYEPHFFTTLAGRAGEGVADGVGEAAYFAYPQGTAADNSGNVYVADTTNCIIRKITAGGVVSTFAGSPRTPGSADGVGREARFAFPQGLGTDAGGNIYVADTNNHTIRKISPDGTVTTVAGVAGVSGNDDGPISSAKFDSPTSVAVDTSGNVYVAQPNDNTIRKISSAGVVTTLAGLAGSHGSSDGTGSAARFFGPYGVAVDTGGNVYVADSANFTIRKITPSGTVSTIAGSAGSPGTSDGLGPMANFGFSQGITVDASGVVYVADTDACTIRKVAPVGLLPVYNVSTLAGASPTITPGSADGQGTAARFGAPAGLTVDNSGIIYVADAGNSDIRRITASGSVTTFAGAAGGQGYADGSGDQARFWGPERLAVDIAGNVFVAESGNSTVRRITPAGEVSTVAGIAGTRGSTDGDRGSALFDNPSAVAVDNAGNLYVTEFDNDTIRMILPNGAVMTPAGSPGVEGSDDGVGTNARFRQPSGIAVDSSGNLYVADLGNNTIRKITPGWTVSTFAGLAGSGGSTDGTGSEARFDAPAGIAVDSKDNLYVADRNETVRKITPAGVVTTLAGSAGNFGSADGVGSAARFGNIGAITVDKYDNVYVADYSFSTVRKITPSGVVTTLAGSPTSVGHVDGAGSAANFQLPDGIVTDASGNIYVADSEGDTIRVAHSVAVTSAVSNKSHGAAGIFGIDLLHGTAPVIECRSGGSGNNYTIVFTFTNSVSVGSANLSFGSGTVESIRTGGNQVQISLSGVPNAGSILLNLVGVDDGTNVSSVQAGMAILVGDTNGDGFVNSADIGQTKSQSGQPVTSSNFREDVNGDGFINSADIGLVKSRSGTALP